MVKSDFNIRSRGYNGPRLGAPGYLNNGFRRGEYQAVGGYRGVDRRGDGRHDDGRRDGVHRDGGRRDGGHRDGGHRDGGYRGGGNNDYRNVY